MTIDSQSGKSINDVHGFYASGKSIEFFPLGLDKVFSNNLILIIINFCGLKEIHQADLKPFTKLRSLVFLGNSIKVIEEGLFAYNSKLEFVSFYSNKIVYIDSNVFDHLTSLTWLYLHYNPCTTDDMEAERNSTALNEIKRNIQNMCNKANYLINHLQKTTSRIDQLEENINKYLEINFFTKYGFAMFVTLFNALLLVFIYTLF